MAAIAIAAAVAATAAVAGGVMGAKGAMASGKAAYTAGQVEYHQELEKTHYNVKIRQREMLAAMHYQMAQAGGSGAAADVGSPLFGMMKTLNDLEEDKAQMYRTGAKNAHKLWLAGADKFSASQYQATSSLLSGISGAASSYTAYKKG
jgi:hypothetical protein